MHVQDVLPFIHSAARDKQYYEPLLNCIVNYMDAEKGALQVEDLRKQKVLSGGVYFGYDANDLKTYHDYYSLIEPWTPRFLDKIKSTHLPFVKSDDVMHLKQYCSTEFYHDWAKPLNVKHSLACALRLTDDLSLKICVKRGDKGAFKKEDINKSNLLWPYLNQLLHGLRSSDMLDNNQVPYWIVDTSGKVISQSESSLNSEMVVLKPSSQTNTITLLEKEAQSELERLLHGLKLGIPFSPSKVKLSANCYVIFQEHFIAGDHLHASKRCVLVYLKFLPTLVNLMSSYMLTEKRASLLQKLLAGESVQHIANQLNVSVHAVRRGLKQLFSVVGVSSQSELIQTVHTNQV